MSSPTEIFKRFTVGQARLLTDAEAANANVPLTKYRNTKKARALAQIPNYIVLPAYTTNSVAAFTVLLFQYNITMPSDFYILLSERLDVGAGALCVKYRVDNILYRYFLGGLNPFLPKTTDTVLFQQYNGEQIKANCSFEYWHTNPFAIEDGLNEDLLIKTGLLSVPSTVDEQSVDNDSALELDIKNAIPLALPADQTNLVWLNNL